MRENLTSGLHYATYLEGERSKAVVDVERLAELLPHGSGLDGDWYITVRKNGDIGLTGEWHQMDENGYYSGWRTVRASIVKVRKRVLHGLPGGFAQVVNEPGDIVLKTATRGDLGDYIHEMLDWELRSLIGMKQERTGPQRFEIVSGKEAEWSEEKGGWVVKGEVV